MLASHGFDRATARRFDRVDASAHTPWGMAIETGERTVAHFDGTEEPESSSSAWMSRVAGYRSAQATPLIARTGKAIGMLSTHWREHGVPTERELRFLDLLARQAADLIERKRATELLCASEERLRRAMSIDTVGVIFFGADGTITEVNEAFVRMSGYSHEDVAHGRVRWNLMTPPEFMASSNHAIQELLSRGETTPYEKQYIRKDGSRWWGLFAAKLLRKNQGVEFILDVTQRKQAERALRVNEARQSFLLELGDALREFDEPARIMTTAAELLGRQLGVAAVGYSEVESDGDNVMMGGEYNDGSMPSPKDRHRISDHGAGFAVALRAGHEIFTEDVLADPRAPAGGSPARHALKARSGGAVPLMKGGRFVAYLYAIHPEPREWPEEERRLLRDVADRTWSALERVRAESALRESEERFRSLVEPWAQFVWEADAVGEPVKDTVSWSAFSGQGAESARREGWVEMVHPEDRVYALRSFREGLKTLKPMNSEYRIRTHEGQWRWTNLRAVPLLDEEGKVRCWVGMNIDITDRKCAEESLKQANRAKDEFLAILAHELRNPLAPLSNGLELLKLGAGDTEAVRHALAMMDRQLRQLIRLTDDLLDVGRINSGKVELRRERLVLADVLRQAVETSQPVIDASANELSVELPPEPILLNGDATRLSQVFSNLLNNAAKYSPEGAPISLRAERQGESVVVRVRDAGLGIPPEMLQRVFEIFTQVDRSLEKARGGLGVGLSLVRGLIELHGGTVEARSAGSGQGSEFVVRLPLLRAAAVEPAPQPPAQRSDVLAPRRILVVDDNEDAATSLALLLKVMNCETRIAHSGFEALDVAPNYRPEIVLLDLGMPKLNGYDTCRRMRAEPWGEDIVIVALTGWNRNEEDDSAQEAGFDDHLVKPADRSTLAKLIGRPLRSEAAASQPS